jgi:predicted small metal-binding protein
MGVNCEGVVRAESEDAAVAAAIAVAVAQAAAHARNVHGLTKISDGGVTRARAAVRDEQRHHRDQPTFLAGNPGGLPAFLCVQTAASWHWIVNKNV